jgi:hypothetical protein
MSSCKKIVKRRQVEAGHSVLIVTERQISERKQVKQAPNCKTHTKDNEISIT